MKQFILCCLATLCFASCLSDDDDANVLTPQQISQYYNAIRGSYSGKMIFQALFDENSNSVVDTVDVEWTVGADSMLVFRNFPARIVAESIYDADLRNELCSSNPTTTLKCYIGFINNEASIQFLIAPQKIEFPVTYKGADHTLSVIFWADNRSFGYKSKSPDVMEGQLVMAKAFLEDNESKNLLTTDPTEVATIPMAFSTSL